MTENEVCSMHGEDYTRFQVYDALKFILADGYMLASDYEIWCKPPSDLTSAVEKATRNILVSDLGGVISDIKKSIVGYEKRAAQEAENALAELEGREKVDLSSTPSEPTKPPRDRAAAKLTEIIGIFQRDAEPDGYDPTECVAYARGLFALIHQPDPTEETS